MLRFLGFVDKEYEHIVAGFVKMKADLEALIARKQDQAKELSVDAQKIRADADKKLSANSTAAAAVSVATSQARSTLSALKSIVG